MIVFDGERLGIVAAAVVMVVVLLRALFAILMLMAVTLEVLADRLVRVVAADFLGVGARGDMDSGRAEDTGIEPCHHAENHEPCEE